MHTSLATVWSNHWPISQHLQDGRLNAWEACPWHGEESWKPNPAQAKENVISKNNFGRLEKIPWLANFFPHCAWKPIFPWFPWLEKNVKFSLISLISGNPVVSFIVSEWDNLLQYLVLWSFTFSGLDVMRLRYFNSDQHVLQGRMPSICDHKFFLTDFSHSTGAP